MKGKQFKILIKDLSLLEKYGFIKEPKNEKYHWLEYKFKYLFYSGATNRNGNKISCIQVNDNDNQLYLNTCGSYAIKVVCEMYKDGVIEFVPYQSNESRIKEKQRKIKKLEKEIEALK